MPLPYDERRPLTTRATLRAAMGTAVLAGYGLLAAPRQLVGQDIGTTIEVGGGYSRLYHADAFQFDFAMMRPIGHPGATEHRIGLVSRYAKSDLATITFVDDQRYMVGVGARYVVVLDGGAALSPSFGATALVLHASTTDRSYVDSGHPTDAQPNPEDHIGLSATGPAFGTEGGLSIRLSAKSRALVRGTIEYQAVYSNPSTHIVWGVSAGVAMAID